MASSPVLSSDSRRIIGSIFILGLVVVIGFTIVCIRICNLDRNLRKIENAIILRDQDRGREKIEKEAKTPPDTFLEWKTYSINDYTFSHPKNWKAQTPTTTEGMTMVIFTDEKQTTVATLRCPVPGTGYEAWDFKSFLRRFTKDNVYYEIQANFGKPLHEGNLGNVNYILMKRMDEEEGNRSCQLIDILKNQETVFKHIYESIEADPTKGMGQKKVYTEPITRISFSAPLNYEPENYTINSADISTGTNPAPIDIVHIERKADGNIPDCETYITLWKTGSPTSGLSKQDKIVFQDDQYIAWGEQTCQVELSRS